MAIFNKNNFETKSQEEIDELVNSDGNLIGDEPSSDIGVSSNSEISTNLLKLDYADKSIPTTGDKVRGSIRQAIPFPYNVWAGRSASVRVSENKLTKTMVEEMVDDLVKKTKNDGELTEKDFNSKLDKILKLIDDDLSDLQLKNISDKIANQMDKPKKNKNL